MQAVEQLGVDQAIPSRILDLMKVEGLTRHNVASHLQVSEPLLSKIHAMLSAIHCSRIKVLLNTRASLHSLFCVAIGLKGHMKSDVNLHFAEIPNA